MNTEMKKVAPGDIIQITDEKHSWYPCLLIVDEVKSWGVQAYISVPQSNDGTVAPGAAFNRLNWADFELVGHARVVAL